MSDGRITEETQQEMLSRLRRIEGQARGVQRMVEERRDCAEIVHQLASIRAATQSATLFLLKHYARDCWVEAASRGAEQPIEDWLELVFKASP
jgi:DNA-binding FrmR family transcriptional regulator